MNKNKRGFTLIELLVVIAIIGLLSTLAVVALGSARQKANDSKRLSDIKQIQTALELYYTDNNAYPAGTAIDLGSTDYACLNSATGFTTAACPSPYMGLVPKGPGSSEYYSYTMASSTYTITATLEVGAGGFTVGAITASPSGLTQ
ncbi:MAG: prepilin-type N-terminal cleavage/methylation domain-containing protein [Candidatus Magasanikbacteria bacterium]|nr:prepilin-type N-terminal cleavage/methylation domain-containing protein [Candidatus Magasanikbacteria bacterium]